MKNSRRTAAFIIARWILTKDFPANLLPEGPDRAFVQELVYTTIRRFRPLRRVLGELLKTWPKGELEALLYVGAAQLLYLPGIPDFAAVHETVEAAKACENPSIAKVVNAVLRNIVRQREALLARVAAAPLAERESFPTEIVRRWTVRFGEEGAARLAQWHNEPAETYLAYPDRFEKLPRAQRVDQVEGYAQGAFIVQDPATALAVSLVAPQPGERILDACAAPGGKTVQLAWRGAAVTACEVNPKRRRKLVENLSRTQLSAQVKVVDSLAAAAAEMPGGYDKVLVDAPCSNTGVFRRRPDARWNWSVEKLAALVALQREILDQAAACVAPGGLLVYSTCSNEEEENVRQAADFLSRHPAFEQLDARESIPFETDMDGAFAVQFRKRASPVAQ
jgi:16S rRNA (cytosine967-C5)-methyltransferase